MKLLVLARYDQLGASSRLRSYQFLRWYQAAGIECKVHALITDSMLREKYSRGRYSVFSLLLTYFKRAYIVFRAGDRDLIWIEKELLPFIPAFIEKILLGGKPYVIDFDDAIFHNYDLHRSRLVRQVLGKKIDQLMALSLCVVAGNAYIAARAQASGAPQVVKVPTVIDLDRYRAAPPDVGNNKTGEVVVGWIGSPTSIQYLRLIEQSLANLSARFNIRLRVICSNGFAMSGVLTESIPWAETDEVRLLQECDIGVMPLEDSAFERGKCGYKLIQYMGCGLPVVASPIGVNVSIVENGINGYLACSEAEWLSSLEALIGDPVLRKSMGAAGRQRVEQSYCVQVVAADLTALILKVSKDL